MAVVGLAGPDSIQLYVLPERWQTPIKQEICTEAFPDFYKLLGENKKEQNYHVTYYIHLNMNVIP